MVLKQIRAYKLPTAFTGIWAMINVFASEATELIAKSPK